MIEKMCFVSIIGYVKDINRVIEKYIYKFNIKLEYAKSQAEYSDFDELDLGEEPDELIKKSLEIIDINKSNKLENNLFISEDEAVEIIKSEIEQNNNFFVSELENEYKELKSVIYNLSHFENLDFNYDIFEKFDFISYRFGFIPVESYEQYKAFLKDEKDIFLIKGEQQENKVWCIYFTHQEALKRVDDIFSSLNFEEVDLPFEINDLKLKGNLSKILLDLKEKLAQIEEKLKNINKKLETNIDFNNKKISAAKKILELNDMRKIKKFCAVVKKDFFVFTGWIVKKKLDLLSAEIRNDDNVVLKIESDFKTEPPVVLKNNFIFRPFEFLVKLYGIPGYHEIDPTPFLAITYIVLFGLMFGDVGQGLVLFLAGMILNKIKKKPLYKIISILGISAAVFGLMYGSFFGFEDVIKNIWLKPAESINYILVYSVAMGIFLILVSMVLNLINCKKSSDWIGILVGPNALSGFIFYICMISVGLFLFTGLNLKYVFWFKFIICFGLVNLCLTSFNKLIKKLFKHERDIFDGNIFLFLFESIIETFEIILNYFTNALSFVRVGAFALSHAGMMNVVMLLAKKGDSYNWFIVVFGNLLVIILEGLIVGIQALRLEFYEMFGRFFRGGGKEYISKN